MPHKGSLLDPWEGHRKVGQEIQTLDPKVDINQATDADWSTASDSHKNRLILAVHPVFNPIGTPTATPTPSGTPTGTPSATTVAGMRLQSTGVEFETSWATWDEAYKVAMERGFEPTRRVIGMEGVPVEIPANFEITLKNSRFSINEPGEAEDGVSYEIRVSPLNGDIIAINRANPNEWHTVIAAPQSPPMGSKKVPGDPIPNGDGSFTQPYEIIDSQGRSRIHYVKIPATSVAPKESDIVDLGDAGRLIPLGGGKYSHEAPAADPFVTSPSDVIPLPDQNGSLIKTSENQYQFVRDTYDPGVKVDDQTGRQFVQSASGNWTELDPRFQQGVVESGGRQFLQQTTGALAELDPRYTPEVTDVDGMSLLQQRSGAISQLAKPNLDQVITQALVDGEYDKAFAFQDFRDRPSAAETFQTALEFARSPADQILISSIARGEQTVQPPPAGTIQRVGPQADFLVQAYQDFQRLSLIHI